MLLLKQTNRQSHTQINAVLYVYDGRIQRENSSSNQKKKSLSSEGKYQTYILKKSTISSADRYPSLALVTARFFIYVSEWRLHRQIPFIAGVDFQQQI